MNSKIVIIVELFCDTAHRTTGPAIAQVHFGATAVNVQVGIAGTRVLGTAPVFAAVTTGKQRATVVIPAAGSRQHQIIAKKKGGAVVCGITIPNSHNALGIVV